jgi:hypothetical protein
LVPTYFLIYSYSWDAFEQDKFDRLQADIERLEVEEQERNKEIDDRDAIIESLRERLAELESMSNGTEDKKFEEKMRLQVEGFQEQVLFSFRLFSSF